MRNIIFCLFFNICLLQDSVVIAQVQYFLGLDEGKSSLIGAENLIFFQHAVSSMEDRYFKSRWFEEDTGHRKALGVFYRLSKTVLLDNVIDHLAVLVQHEVFGHGSRYREFGYKENFYSLSLFPPYGDGRGYAARGRLTSRTITTFHEQLVMTMGGSEANTQLSKSIRTKWLHRGSIKYRETVFYLFSANDLSWYIIRTKLGGHPLSSNDIIRYLEILNFQEGYRSQEDYRLDLDNLTRQSFINMLNPFQYISIYAYFATYLWKGDKDYEFPMLKFFGIRYLPSFRFGLTPFGSEFYFENFIVNSQQVWTIYFRHGISTFHSSEGFGVGIDNLLSNQHISLNASLDLWHQPSLLLGGTTTTHSRSGLGGGFTGTFFYKVKKSRPSINLAFQFKYKTVGFLEGEHLSKGFTGGFGISFVE